MTDDKPSPEEQAAAQALARALDGEGSPEVPDDALQAAALLRYSRDGGELAPSRRAAILDELLAQVAPRQTRAVSSSRRWRAPAGTLAAFGAAALLAVALLPPTMTPASPTPLPSPRAALLDAQSAAARSGADFGALRREMQAYRGEMYAALLAHYDTEGSAR